jgi:sigma-E factor negative regulatory protein RseA
MNEELDSQLSAMFDDELPPAECELLARRLSRDEQLKARWGRYAVIGAAIRAERGVRGDRDVRLNARVAGRVNARIVSEPALSGSAEPHASSARRLWWQPLAGTAVAAGVAAAAILWLRGQLPPAAAPLAAQASAASRSQPATALPVAAAGNAREPVSYVVPPAPAAQPALVPSTELANYVVAHSMFSTPVARRNLLSAFMTSGEAVAAPAVSGYDAQHDAQSRP